MTDTERLAALDELVREYGADVRITFQGHGSHINPFGAQEDYPSHCEIFFGDDRMAWGETLEECLDKLVDGQ